MRRPNSGWIITSGTSTARAGFIMISSNAGVTRKASAIPFTWISSGSTRTAARTPTWNFSLPRDSRHARRDNLVGITGNPVLVVYMQGDVYEMNRLTNGSWRYFQRRIKSAFAEGAKIEPVTFEYGGTEMTGEKISITPYLNDPRRRQFAQFAPKIYEFILSEQVPGKLYQIKTVIPAGSPDSEPLMEETLTLQNAEFAN